MRAYSSVAADTAEKPSTTFYDFSLYDIDGKPVSLAHYRGKVLLVVNVASKCGFTYQYAALEELYKKYRGSGFEVLGFPSNDFLGQEPGSNEQIKEFCSLSFGVSFPLFAKISVRGRKIHPFYRFLTDKKENPGFGGPISWNFNKFLIDRDGRIVARFGSRDEPMSEKVTAMVEQSLEPEIG